MYIVKRSIASGLHLSTVVFESWYFASILVEFLGQENKDWITEAKSNRNILVNGSWVKLMDYAASLNIRNMAPYSIDGNTYLMKSIITRMKNARKVHVIVSMGKNSQKFFVTNRSDWKPAKVIELYVRRWDIETFHRELKQDGLKQYHL